MFGGVQVITFVVMLIRSKVVAQYLGPDGYGINTLFNSALLFVTGISSLGLNNSAVRELAEKAASGDRDQLNKSMTVFVRWTAVCGLAGTLFVLIFSGKLSKWTFDSGDYKWSFLALSVIPVMTIMSNARISLLQGTGRLKNIARINILSALLGLLSLPLYYFYNVKAIVPVLIILAVIPFLLSLYYSRDIHYEKISLTVRETFTSGAGLVRLGLLITFSSYFYLTGTYLFNLFVAHITGPSDVGLYQAGWLIANQSVGLVLTAMSTYYYPQLASMNKDHDRVRQFVNQQVEITVLVMGPILIALIVFIPLAIRIFLAPSFLVITDFVRLTALGTFFRALTWCLGFILLARNDTRRYMFCEITGYTVMFAGYFAGYYLAGLKGLGIAYIAGYIFHFLLTLYLNIKTIQFRFQRETAKIIFVFAVLAALTYLASRLESPAGFYTAATILMVVALTYAYLELDKRLNVREFIKSIRIKNF